MWEIQDNNGTIYSGSEDEMRQIFDKIKEENSNNGLLPDEYETISEWNGDLKLVQIHEFYN